MFPLTGDEARVLLDLVLLDNPAARSAWSELASNGDRNSADTARQVFESIFPDARIRGAVLLALAGTMLEASRTATDRWGITLFADRFRLNVGMLEAFVASARWDSVMLLVDAETLAEAEARLPSGWGSRGKPAADVPGLLRVVLATRSLENAFSVLRDAHVAALRKVSFRRRQGYLWKDSHSPGIVQYVREATGADIPNPAYVSEVPADGSSFSECAILLDCHPGASAAGSASRGCFRAVADGATLGRGEAYARGGAIRWA